MTGIVLSVILAVLAAIASVFSIAAYLNRGSFLQGYSPAGRVLFTVTLCLIGLLAGWHAIDEARSRVPTNSGGDQQPRVGTDAPATSQGDGSSKQPATRVSQDRYRGPEPRAPKQLSHRSITSETTATRVRIQDDTGNLVPGLILIAQRELPSNLTIEGTLHMATTPPDEALQGVITANARLSVTTKNAKHLIDGFDLEARGGGFTAEAATSQALERLEAEFSKRLKEHS